MTTQKIFDPKVTPGKWELFNHQTKTKVEVKIPSGKGYDILVESFSLDHEGLVPERKDNFRAIAALPELLEVLKAARVVVKMDDDHLQFVEDTQHCHPDDVAQDKEYLKHTFIAIDRLRDIVDKLDQTHGTAKGDE